MPHGAAPRGTILQSVNSTDWAAAASLATALGTLVLAVATFGSVRSANRAARAAEQSLLVGLRPLLVPSRFQDESQKIMFGDGKWIHVPGGRATVQAEDGAIYLIMSLRNVGRGIAVVHGWHFYPGWEAHARIRTSMNFAGRTATCTCRREISASGRRHSGTRPTPSTRPPARR